MKVIDRRTKEFFQEKIYGKRLLLALYKKGFFFKGLNFFITRFSLISSLYGFLQKLSFSKTKIKPFIEEYKIDSSEFEEKVDDFCSFNDFFIRKLKPEVRPSSKSLALLPADGRYLVFPDISKISNFFVKEKEFNLESFLQDSSLAKKYQNGSMVIARLCPIDYHRFHFPIDCFASEAKLIKGFLKSVHPLALKGSLKTFLENKRMITKLKSEVFNEVLYIEVGATNVGSIHQTYKPKKNYNKGDEKGYFSFGGSTIVMLFQEGKIQFDSDLIENSQAGFETYARVKDSLGSLPEKK